MQFLAANFDKSGLPPIYPVLIGKDDPARDISISNVKISQTSFEDAPVTVQADVAHSGYSGANLVARIFEAGARGSTNLTRATNAASNTNLIAGLQKVATEQTLKAASSEMDEGRRRAADTIIVPLGS